MRMSVCHPEKKHYAKDSCYSCYYKKKLKEDPTFRAKTLSRAREVYKSNPRKKLETSRKWLLSHPEWTIHQAAKDRSKKKGLEFNIEVNDINIPDICPVLNIPVKKSTTGRMTDNSPALDRIDNTKGYIKGNIIVVSNRANRLKGDGTPDELRKIAEFYFALQ